MRDVLRSLRRVGGRRKGRDGDSLSLPGFGIIEGKHRGGTTVSITIAEPSVEERIRRHLDSGRFVDAGEVVARALDAMEQAERRRAERDAKVEQLRALIAEADADFERGDFYEGTPEFWDELEKEALRARPLGAAELPEHLRP